jgi:hypothetical protein
MRLPQPTPPIPDKRSFDVVISQACGVPANGYTVRSRPHGASESQVVLLAETLVARGYTVAVLTPGGTFARYAGVEYIPLSAVNSQRPTVAARCSVLISERFGEIPANVVFGRLVFDLHDLPDDRLKHVMAATDQVKAQVVVHSEYMRGLLPDWPRVNVIPCMLPDEFYTTPVKSRDPGRERVFVYGSAAAKGLRETLMLWATLKKNAYMFKRAKLIVLSPGYDRPDDLEAVKKIPGVEWREGLTQAQVQDLLANEADALLTVNSYPETFGVVHAQAEIACRPSMVRHLKEPGALTETLASPTVYSDDHEFLAALTAKTLPVPLPAKDYRASRVIEQWLEVLGLATTPVKIQQEMEVA